MKRMIAITSVFLMITGCNQAPAPADPSAITSRSEAWEQALNAKDIDALVDLYTSDARVLPPNGKMKSGSDAVRKEFSAMIDAGLSVNLTSVEAMVSGDIGYNVGSYTLKSGGERADAGKYIEIWHRGDDGQWLITNDIYNSDLAMKADGDTNTHLMITHKVKDGDRWLAAWRGKDSRKKLFKANGAADVHTFRSADNPNLTGLVVSVKNMKKFEAMLKSDDGKAAAATDGVDMQSMIMLTETK